MPRKQPQDEPAPGAAPSEPKRLTPVEIQQKEFRLAFRGYHEGEVDRFLDDLTEEVARLYAENKRLREELDFKRTERLGTQVPGEVDALLRQAREEAARIVEDARAQAVAMSGEGVASSGAGVQAGVALLGPFLAREREFLQGLASLIQGHADAVKTGIRRAREDMAVADEPDQATTINQEPSHVQEEEEEGSTQSWSQAPASAAAEEEQPAAEPHHEAQASWDDDRESSNDAGSDEPPGGLRSGERIMDLTDDAVDVGQTPQPVAADDRDDRTIREFFWGED